MSGDRSDWVIDVDLDHSNSLAVVTVNGVARTVMYWQLGCVTHVNPAYASVQWDATRKDYPGQRIRQDGDSIPFKNFSSIAVWVDAWSRVESPKQWAAACKGLSE